MSPLQKLLFLFIFGIFLQIIIIAYTTGPLFQFISSYWMKRSTKIDDKAKHNIVFLKTHKTGGTTLQNILMRYGDVNNLTFLFFKSSDGLKPGSHFPAVLTPKLVSGMHYNIICRHARFDKKAIQSVMPNDSVYITIVRDPVQHFKSIFWYYNWPRTLKLSHNKNPLAYYVENIDQPEFDNRHNFPFNWILFELGMKPIDMVDEQKVNETIKQLGKDFHLVLLTEYFDESLILLRRILNWELKEMVYFKMRSRSTKSEELTEKQKKKIKEKSRLHVLLYEFFNKTLWRKINELEGEGFWEEVRDLRRLREKTVKNCIDEEITERPKSTSTYFHNIRNDTNDRATCNRLTVPPIPYTVYLIKRQLPYLFDKSIATYYSFVFKLFWKVPSWDPINGFKENETLFQRVCKDSGKEIQKCKEEVDKMQTRNKKQNF